MGTGDSFPEVKWPGREADHSLPSAEVKNAWRYTYIPQYVFKAWCLLKHREKVTFLLNFHIPNKYLKVTLPFPSRFFNWVFKNRFLHQNLVCTSSPILATCPGHHSPLNFIIVTVTGEPHVSVFFRQFKYFTHSKRLRFTPIQNRKKK